MVRKLGLLTYVARRLILLIPVVLGVSMLIFAITMCFPPTIRALLYIRNPQALTPENIEGVIKKYHLNDPFYIQYFTWLAQVLQGNLGWSQTASAPVFSAILVRFPATFEIIVFAAPVIIILGLYLGIQSAVYKDKILDHITRSAAIIGWSLPSFWFGFILMAVFYGYLGWLPPGRLTREVQHFVDSSQLFTKYTGLYILDGILNGQLAVSWDAFKHVILPATVITVIDIALIIRVARSSMLEALSKGYIITAKAKGLTQKEVINKHARRNALIPVTTISGLLVASLMTGVVITETVFGFGGLGSWAAQSAQQLDVPSVLGFAMFTAIVFVIANLIVDVLYAFIDPRIRLA
ncbi:MAG: ABC transporter permease [Candidatus Bathyarchaeota archaeon]|nr:ABC transporter permease [Candidatus Bathyarchaeota archaeon]